MRPLRQRLYRGRVHSALLSTAPSMSEPIRLSKRVIELTGCSRAQAERYIEGGCVSVDGEVIDRPEHPVREQRVEVDLEAIAAPLEPMTVLLHKPAGVEVAPALVAADRHWADDPSGIRPLRRHLRRLSPLLPLEHGACGLQPFTQDGRLLHRMREEGARIEQEFIVEVEGSVAAYGLHRLSHGLRFEGRTLPPCKVSWQSETRLRFAIKDVRPGQLAWMCGQVDLRLLSARRIRLGRVPLAKLPESSWRYLPRGERF
ncbi:23S rRNA pseudouridine2604 synthase [Aquimonas voraii]|uniref:Dual-specificity RNA pseudouridine synthase RluF n=2 Tax=Aquimonas voraii TaxID=265719 RepID=A0A1G6UKE7_9GAMM|nr:23S rRNA pseudouridine2604 synthase [Aquimonas voraii]